MTDLSSFHLKRLGGEFFWIGFGQVLAVLGGIVGLRLLTGVLSPAGYGELALGMTLATLAQQVLLGPISQGLIRFFAHAQETSKLDAYFRAALVLLAQAAGIALIAVGLITAGLLEFGYTKWIFLLLIAFVFSFIDGCNSILDGIQNAARRRIIVAWHQGIGQWLRFIFATFLITIAGSSGDMALSGYVFASLLMIISRFIFFMKEIIKKNGNSIASSRNYTEDFAPRMRGYAWPFAIWGVFTWAQIASDRWALQGFEDINAVGLYAVLYQIGYYPMNLLMGIMVQLVSPILFSLAGDASDAFRLNKSNYLNCILFFVSILFTLFTTILAFVFHKQIFSIIVSAEYNQISWMLPFMIFASGLFASAQVVALFFMNATDTKKLLLPKICTALMCVSLNFTGSYLFGIFGVVLANIAFSLTYLIWMLILAEKKYIIDVFRLEMRHSFLSKKMI